jgi:tripartite ATP-independent transporter DctM subunit
VLAVLVAITAEVSVGKMLIAGIGPGLLLTSLFLAYVLLRVRANPKLAPDLAAELAGGAAGSALGATRSALGALARMVPPLFVFFMVMGLIMLGVATPTEAAATGVLGALAVALYYGRLGWPMVRDALAAAATVAALLLAIMCSAVMFSQLLTVTGAAAALAELVTGVRPAAWLMVFILLAVPFVLFMFLDQLAIMLMIVPIYQPILKLYGFDGIWFWTLFLITVTAGGLTPPFGYILFALKSAAPDVPMRTIYRASWPFVRILVLGLVLCALFPGIVTYLPGLSR